MALSSYVDHREDPAAWAATLGISREAVELYLASEMIDLHVDSFIWTRILGYDLTRRHGASPFAGHFYSQVDLPRMREACVGGAMWSITTSPFRGSAGRAQAFGRNVQRLREVLAACPEDVAIVRTHAEYRAARASGRHAAMLAIQGGNAIDEDLAALELLGDDVLRVTLVHLSTSRIGTPSVPSLRGDQGLSSFGKQYVEALDARRVFVDLAHIGRKSFFDAVAVHDRSRPLLCTHTGVSGVTPHWRNIDDEQLRAIADSGGTVGIILHRLYLGGASIERVVDHIDHAVRTIGDDHVSFGSDFDGLIMPPRELPSCLELPRLVEHMLRRGYVAERVQKILGGNFLRTLRMLRG